MFSRKGRRKEGKSSDMKACDGSFLNVKIILHEVDFLEKNRKKKEGGQNRPDRHGSQIHDL
jgi:hypothetical protein